MVASVSEGFSFTKLVVHDLEAMAQYYASVFGLEQLDRFKTGHAIDEKGMGPQPNLH